MKTWQTLRANPDMWERYLVRERVLRKIRSFFEKEKFHEVETPILIAHPPAESYLDVFETTLLDRNRKPTKAYLSTSPEVALKKLMVAGLGNCFAITKSFRNTETSSKIHNPEFTILEWYRIGVSYTAIMDDCERLLRKLAPSITYQGNTINLNEPWERLSISAAFKKYAHIDFNDFFTNAPAIAKSKGYSIDGKTWEELYNQIFLNEVEPHLGFGRPTILYEFPGSMAALAKKKSTDSRFAERFEFYIAGLELGDAYSELTDAKEQEKRFNIELKEIKRLGKTVYDYDHDFIDALKMGLPECSGVAVGVDRLVMLLTDTTSITDVLLFPASESFF